MPLTDHPLGNYRFLPGISPYSCGVVSSPGFEIVHVAFQQPVAFRQGFREIEKFLADQKRPKAALCGIELRSPKPYTFEGFKQFNAEYTAILKEWGVFVADVNPVARTNVAPVIDPPKEPVLYGFSFSKKHRTVHFPHSSLRVPVSCPKEFCLAKGSSPLGTRRRPD